MPRPGDRRRRLGREVLVVAVAAVALAVTLIWLVPPYVGWLISGAEPTVADPSTTILGDAYDPAGQAWLLGWGGHALLHDLGHVWDTNAFYPDRGGLAFNDSLLGYAPFGMVGAGPAAALLRYNVVYLLAFALATAGAYALVRQLGANRIGAAVAGVAFAYAPWRYGHDGHLNILSSGGIVLALAMLARGHGWSLRGGYRPDRVRPGWAFAGWLVAGWQISLGFGIGLPFVYLLALVCLAASVGWLATGRPRLGRRLVLGDLFGALVFAAVTASFAARYEAVRAAHPETLRTWDYVAMFSPSPKGLLVAPRSSLVWGDLHAAARDALGVGSNEKTLLCGFLLYGLAAAGLFRSVWRPGARVLLAAGATIGALFALGAQGPLYRLLYVCVPGFDGGRTPGRLILWSSILLVVLAAGCVTELAERVRRAVPAPRGRLLAAAVTVPLLLLTIAEDLPNIDHVAIPTEPVAIAAVRGPTVVLPSDDQLDLTVMLWSTDRFPVMVNGVSSISTPDQQGLRALLRTFPSPDCVARLRAIGIRSVVVLRDRIGGTDYRQVLDGSIDGRAVTRTDVGPDVVFTIGPA